MSDFLKSKIALKASSQINDIIMRQALGFKAESDVFSTSTAQKPIELTVAKLEEIVNQLHSDNLDQQKSLIRLLASVGFDVKLMDGFEMAMVFLPTKYKQAMQEIREEQEDE